MIRCHVSRCAFLLLLLWPAAALAQDPFPAEGAEKAAIAGAFAEGILAIGTRDAEGVLAGADEGLLADLRQVLALTAALPAERLLPPFEGEACAPLWASSWIVYLRAHYLRWDDPVAKLKEESDRSLLALMVEYGAMLGFDWEKLVKDTNFRRQLEQDPLAALQTLGGLKLYRAGERAYVDSGIFPGVVFSIALRQPDGSWWPDYRYFFELVREVEVMTSMTYQTHDAMALEDMPPRLFGEGLVLFMPREWRPADILDLAQPLAANGAFSCLPPAFAAPRMLCLADGPPQLCAQP